MLSSYSRTLRKLSTFRPLLLHHLPLSHNQILSHHPPLPTPHNPFSSSPLFPTPNSFYCTTSSPSIKCSVSYPVPESSETDTEQPPRYNDDAYAAIELALNSVVKIFTVSSSPNYFLPWQNKSQRETMGSGFVIEGRKILTNAHVVADHTFVLVRKHGCPTKYRAEVKAVGHECDLAILSVESEEFWEGMTFLELGDIPFLQEAVAVVGYPQGSTLTSK